MLQVMLKHVRNAGDQPVKTVLSTSGFRQHAGALSIMLTVSVYETDMLCCHSELFYLLTNKEVHSAHKMPDIRTLLKDLERWQQANTKIPGLLHDGLVGFVTDVKPAVFLG
jgi:hypothetical protein